jgi:hypothetical protein
MAKINESRPQGIDTIKSLISKRGGVARGNRFGIHISHPVTNLSKILAKKWNVPVQNYISNNITEMENFITDGRDTYLLCSGVTLPGKRISTTEAAHNHNLSKKPYSMATDEVTTTFLVTNDYYIKKYFDLWQEIIVDSTHNHYRTRYKKEYCAEITIQALQGNEEGTIGYANILENAYPIQIGQLELNNESEGLMELTVTWEYDNWRTTDLKEGFQSLLTSNTSNLLPIPEGVKSAVGSGLKP